jgi:hypothetical protein
MIAIVRLSARPIRATLGLLVVTLVLMPQAVRAESVTQTYRFERPTITKVTLGGQEYDRIVLKDAPNSDQMGDPTVLVAGAPVLADRTVLDVLAWRRMPDKNRFWGTALCPGPRFQEQCSSDGVTA